MTRIAEVAKKAGVSVATVSRALSKPEMVAAETRALIEQVAALGAAGEGDIAGSRGRSFELGLVAEDMIHHATAAGRRLKIHVVRRCDDEIDAGGLDARGRHGRGLRRQPPSLRPFGHHRSPR